MWQETREQRCWNYNIMNVLDKFPKRVQPDAKEHLCKMPYAETRAKCERLKESFERRFEADYPKAVKTLSRD